MSIDRIRYSPSFGVPMICHACDADFEEYSSPQIIPAGFDAPYLHVALLCDACSREFWQREAEAARREEEWLDKGCPE